MSGLLRVLGVLSCVIAQSRPEPWAEEDVERRGKLSVNACVRVDKHTLEERLIEQLSHVIGGRLVGLSAVLAELKVELPRSC